MSELLPPIPKQPMDPTRPESVAMWKRQFFDPLFRILGKVSGTAWEGISKAGSKLSDIEQRGHEMLTGIAGWSKGSDDVQDKHISQAQGSKWENHADLSSHTHHGVNHDEAYAAKSAFDTAMVSISNTLDAKAPINSPAFTGTVSGINKAMVGLPHIDDTSDADKPVSAAQQTALDAKAPATNPIFTIATAAPTLPANQQMALQLVSNTQLKIMVRGSDGTTRSVILALA